MVHLVRSRRQALGVIVCGLTLLLPLPFGYMAKAKPKAVEAGGVEPESGEVTAAKVAAAGEAVAEDVEPEEAEEGAEFYRELDDGRIVRRYGQGMASIRGSKFLWLVGGVICGLVTARRKQVALLAAIVATAYAILFTPALCTAAASRPSAPCGPCCAWRSS